MAKQRMIVTDDQLLIDMDLLFNAIREADGDWEKVEQDMQMYLGSIQGMVDGDDNDSDGDDFDDEGEDGGEHSDEHGDEHSDSADAADTNRAAAK